MAVAPLMETAEQPDMEVDPSLKFTVPVAPLGTVAVKVTDWLKLDGLGEELRLVVEDAWFTVWETADDVDALKLVSPPYTAVIEWVPTASAEVVNVACPLAFSVPVPSVDEPPRKVMVPEGVPALLVTVAVKVTELP